MPFDIQLNSLLRQLKNVIIKEVDNEKVQTIIEDQIELLSGNKLLYERMNKNLKEHKFEPQFAQELMMLYEWRKDFFYKFCGRRPSIGGHAITPYHITKNFEVVMAMVCSTSDLLNSVSYHRRGGWGSCPEDCKCLVWYFEENPIESSYAYCLFDRECLDGLRRYGDLSKRLEKYGLGFNEKAQRIMAVHRVGPCSLLESALKATVLNDLSLEEVPKAIQKKASHGLYKLEDDIPENLTPEGKQLFGQLKAQYEEDIQLE